jgi:hypothetical protein
MSDQRNVWPLTAVAMALVVVTALVAGLVVASWTGELTETSERSSSERRPAEGDSGPTAVDVEACTASALALAGARAAGAGRAGVLAGSRDGLDAAGASGARYARAYQACMRGRGFTG